MSCGAENEANDLMTSLTAGLDFTLPAVNFNDPDFKVPDLDGIGGQVVHLTNADLTTGVKNGTGTLDQIMKSLAAQLQDEFDKGRITGAEYSKTYAALLETGTSNAVQFLLGREQAYWGAVAAKVQAQAATVALVTARVQLETAKAQLLAVRAEALNNQANYALAKMKLSTESIQYCTTKFNLDNILPVQRMVLLEQVEVQRAQTLDIRTDGKPVVGLLGKQKDLYSQQITSYKRDAETKIAKLFTDAWITMKTIDEGLLPPSGFINTSLDNVLSTLKKNVQFDGQGHP